MNEYDLRKEYLYKKAQENDFEITITDNRIICLNHEIGSLKWCWCFPSINEAIQFIYGYEFGITKKIGQEG